MIPKYTTNEIVAMIAQHNGDKHPARTLSAERVWTLKEYTLASNYLNIPIEELMSLLPEEDLNSISFRALENNAEIHPKVQQVNQIFEALTYQLKIGDTND
ncbi:hypothetical protein ACMGE7_01975 [Macrococcus equi]|uniref:hypothetical protein n=1 Tax=Macrococcus equi TaxID=3395462 RepID=UPI0039BEC4CB